MKVSILCAIRLYKKLVVTIILSFLEANSNSSSVAVILGSCICLSLFPLWSTHREGFKLGSKGKGDITRLTSDHRSIES